MQLLRGLAQFLVQGGNFIILALKLQLYICHLFPFLVLLFVVLLQILDLSLELVVGGFELADPG